MNVPEEIAFGAVRFSLGRPTTEQEIDAAVEQVVTAIPALCPAKG
jgi:cysteine sulfinate desulfinase/cysteine desulfurase-like protein